LRCFSYGFPNAIDLHVIERRLQNGIVCRNLPLSASVPGEGEGNEETEELRGE
jgi:hypothetical protein